MDEKGFNEEELSDIMKEIEALEDDTAMDSPVIGALAEMDVEAAVPSRKSEVIDFDHKHHRASKAPTSMTFKVEGELNMELQFDVAGKTVSLAFSEAGLNVCMDGGVTFSVPFEKSQKKTA